MAANQGPGAYRPLTRRARQLIELLKKAKHRAVQNAIIAELVHEMQRGSRRSRSSLGDVLHWLGVSPRKAHGGEFWPAVRKWWNGKAGWGTPGKYHCAAHPRKKIRSQLEWNAHQVAHERQARQPQRIQDGRTVAGPSPQEKARQHARDHLEAAGRLPRRQQQAPARSPDGQAPKPPVPQQVFTNRELEEITGRRGLDRDLRQAREARKRGDELAVAKHEKQAERKRADLKASGFKDTPLTEAQHQNLYARRKAQGAPARVNGTPVRQANGRFAAKPPASGQANGKAPAKPPATPLPANKHGVTRPKDLKAMQAPKPGRKLTLRREPAPGAVLKAPAPKVTAPSPVPPLPSQTVRAPAPRRKLTLTRSR